MSRVSLMDRLGFTAFAFRGYNVTNLGRSQELLSGLGLDQIFSIHDDGSTAPEEHAAPDEHITPCRSSAMTSASPPAASKEYALARSAGVRPPAGP